MKKYILLLPLIILGFTSCEDVIQVDLNEQDTDLYAVEAKINPVDGPSVFLTRAMAVDQGTAYPGISGAVVTIADDAQSANVVTLVEDPKNIGHYGLPDGSNFKAGTGREYTLTIETGGVTLTASDYLAPVEKIDSIQVKPSEFGDNQFLGVFTYGQETPGKGIRERYFAE